MPGSLGVVLTNKANESEGKHIHNFSTFKDSLSYRKYNTLRFGEYAPSFEMEGVERDSISVNSRDIIDSLSLNAPFKGSVRKIKESFMVPNMAILPMNWDKIYAQPANGDDVPKDANCVLMDFPARFKKYWKDTFDAISINFVTLNGQAVISNDELRKHLIGILRLIVLGEYVYSSGSLLNVCGYKGNAQFQYRNPAVNFSDYDSWFDSIIRKVFKNICYFSAVEYVGGVAHTHYYYGFDTSLKPTTPWNYGTVRDFLNLLRENPNTHIVSLTKNGSLTNETYFNDLTLNLYFDGNNYYEFGLDPAFLLPSSAGNFDTNTDITALNPNTLNLSRILAYQLVCAHFYSNSSVDFVYSAELYRQYIKALCAAVHTGVNQDYIFSWNGMNLPYDYLSGHFIERGLYIDPANDGAFTINYYDITLDYFDYYDLWPAIFGFRRSLRYGDYFVGSRPRPLAPINTDVSVNNNLVSVIDITRNIQAQRFANSVMRSRTKIEEYVKSLFGKAPAPDYHNPFFLSRETEVIFGDDVQNTGDAQVYDANSRTANFASNNGRFTFTFHNDDMHPCVYLQILSFDIRRAYTRSVDRQFLHVDRYDMFNPDFQYIGDQMVYGIELGVPNGLNQMPDVFGYQGRDMEYKQRFDVACGGFVKNLPGWCLTDFVHARLCDDSIISPDFIRSYQGEFDQFFLSLTGFSLGSYFHFVCITDNNVDAKRAMAVDPQILA